MPYMLRRLGISALIFLAFCLLWAGMSVFRAYRRIAQGRATGMGLVLSSDLIVPLLLFAALAFWLSGRILAR